MILSGIIYTCVNPERSHRDEMKLVQKRTHRLCPSPGKYGGRHRVTAKPRPHLRKAQGNKETPVCVAEEQVGGGGLPAQYPVLAITKNGEQVPLFFSLWVYWDAAAASHCPGDAFPAPRGCPSPLPVPPRRGPPPLAAARPEGAPFCLPGSAGSPNFTAWK